MSWRGERGCWMLLGLLFVGLCAATILWVSINKRPQEWDYSNHLSRAIECHQILTEPGHDVFREIVRNISAFYPPLTYCLTGILYIFFPLGTMTSQSVMLVALALGMVGVFGLGKRFFDPPTGVMAALFLATAPFVVVSLTMYALDLPQMAVVAMTLWALARTETFSRRGWSSWLGVLLGVGMLMKASFFVYVFPPLLLEVWRVRRAADRRRYPGVALAFGLGLLVALPWYWPRLFPLIVVSWHRMFKWAAKTGLPPVTSLQSLLYYFRTLPSDFGLLAALLCTWGLWALRKTRDGRAFLWLAVLVPFALLLSIREKNSRLLLPLLPALAVVAAAGLQALPRYVRPAMGLACVVLAALQVSMAAFGRPNMPSPIPWTTLVTTRPPDPNDWQHGRILGDLAVKAGERPALVAVVPDYIFFSRSTFRYEALRRGLPYEMDRGWDGPPLGIDYIILKSGNQGPRGFAARKAQRIQASFAADPYLASAFPVVQQYALPDGSRAQLRERRILPLRDMAHEALVDRLELTPLSKMLSEYIREAEGVRIRLDYEPEELLAGKIKKLEIWIRSALAGEFENKKKRPPLRVRDAHLVLERLQFHPRRFAETGKIELYDLGKAWIKHLVITQADLREYLRGQRKARGIEVKLDDGAIEVRGKKYNFFLRIRPGEGVGRRPFTIDVETLRVAGVPVPAAIANWLIRVFDPFKALDASKRHFTLSLGALRFKEGRIEIAAR